MEKYLPFVGLPVLMIVGTILFWGNMNFTTFLLCQTVIVFGYIATVIDIRTMQVPPKLLFAMLSIWVVIMFPQMFFDMSSAISLIIPSLLGAAVGGGVLLVFYFLSKKSLGGGDVKFMAVLGLYLGIAGSIQAMIYASLAALVIGVVLLLMKKIQRKAPIPFVPFLYFGSLVAMLI